MRKLTLFFSIFFTLLNTFSTTVFAVTSLPTITAPSAILIDGDTGDVLYEKSADTQMYPASTTKIMTALLTLENTSLQDTVVIDKDTPFTGGSRIYLIEGEELKIEQLLYALLVDSANDAAVALAKHISGSVEKFAELMNKRAKELGAKNTNFSNPNGLPNDKHVTTAYDLAMIARYAMTLPKFREIVATANYQIPPTNKQMETRYLGNSNRFLWGVGGKNKILYREKWIDIKYDIIEGVKTGYTDIARQCLVTSAKKDGHRLISVVLKAEGKNIYIDSRTLIDYGFENFQFVKITDARKKVKTIPIKNGVEKQLDLITQNKLYKTIPKDKNLGPIDLVTEIQNEIAAPIQKDQILGKVIYKSKGKNLGEVNLIATKSVPEKKGITATFFLNAPTGKSIFYYLLWALFIFIIWRTIVTLNRLKIQKKIRRQKRLRKYYSNHLPSKKDSRQK
ncbi:D-alanyl-D-alanine carboxypeptidase family protein [Marinisporobacter balticus]|uniref:serine-type D-Ala-D-Ala carboxypeptidase n=1 Tax=Marinisporobacter balticus TaxID=2018667 RepID=A0A4R2L0H8_9FIRM|nr:D-alanyl-D-alanine carboxypeptidase family protein [Marinisporobacter balticus]TCO79032.1 D-alanyl-D-alanine carboxypeptidase (penicillin-binding protein 5/6) [Marinisporobacter balticus]